jgi:putative nucleotidyltransferase with HDIG domain
MKDKKFHILKNFIPKNNEATRNQKVGIVVLIIGILAIMLVMPWIVEGNLMGSSIVSSQLQVKQLAPENLFVKRAFEYEDVEKTEQLRAEVLKNVHPIFSFDKSQTYESYKNLQDFVLLFENSTSDVIGKSLTLLSDDESIFVKSQFSSFSKTQKKELLNWIDGIGTQVINLGYAKNYEIEKVSTEGYSQVKIQGTVDGLYDDNSQLAVKDLDLSNLITKENLGAFVNKQVGDLSITSLGYDSEFITLVLKGLLKENLLYNSVATSNAKAIAYDSVQPQNVFIAAGQKVLVKDSIITSDDLELLKQVELNKSLYSTAQIIAREILIVLVTLLTYYFFFTSNIKSTRRISFTLSYLIIMLLTLSATTFILFASSSSRITVLGPLLPVVFGSLFLKNLTGHKKYGFVFALQYAFYAALFPGTTWFTFFYIATIGISSIFIISYVRDRLVNSMSVIFALLIALAMTGILYAIQGYPFSSITFSLIAITVNVIGCIALEKFILPFIDNFLNIPTIFRLRELEKLDSPLLEKLKNQANGTFNHSVGVADLAVAAAKEVGADENLCKIAALYHDVGKMDHPEYFTENQAGINKHDDVSPALSAAMIRTHVRLSVEKCREEGLPIEVITIISEHHGNDVISYFYNEALKGKEENNQSVSRGDFTYNGNPPSSKESAIVMLSDCVEAASHSIKDVTPQKLSRMVANIIKGKFENEQLNDSHLDLTELNQIQSALEKSLMGKYHTRIAYPEETKKNKTQNDNKN